MRLLIVEDDMLMRGLLVQMFSAEPGIDGIRQCAMLEDAVEIVPFVDAVLSDGWFWSRSKLQPVWRVLYQAARAEGIPFTLMTGDVREADYARSMSVPVIEKPFHLEELVAQVMGATSKPFSGK